MKKLIIIAFIVFSASMTKLYSQEISIINLPLNSYDTIKKYYHIPYFKKTCDTIVYDFNFVKDTCKFKLESMKYQNDILLNSKQSETNYWKNAFNQESKYSRTYKKGFIGTSILATILTFIMLTKK